MESHGKTGWQEHTGKYHINKNAQGDVCVNLCTLRHGFVSVEGRREFQKGKNFVSDGTFCTTFCTKKPKNKNCRPLTQCGHVRLILGLFYFQILVLQCKINFQVIA